MRQMPGKSLGPWRRRKIGRPRLRWEGPRRTLTGGCWWDTKGALETTASGEPNSCVPHRSVGKRDEAPSGPSHSPFSPVFQICRSDLAAGWRPDRCTTRVRPTHVVAAPSTLFTVALLRARCRASAWNRGTTRVALGCRSRLRVRRSNFSGPLVRGLGGAPAVCHSLSYLLHRINDLGCRGRQPGGCDRNFAPLRFEFSARYHLSLRNALPTGAVATIASSSSLRTRKVVFQASCRAP